MAINFCILDICQIRPADYEYRIIFYRNCLVPELLHRNNSVRPTSWIDFQKNYLLGHVTCVTSGTGENQNNKSILSDAHGDFVLLVRNLGFFDFLDRKYHDNQRDRILPHQFKPEPKMQTSDSGDASDQNSMKRVSRLPRKSIMCLRPKLVSALKTLAGVNASIAH